MEEWDKLFRERLAKIRTDNGSTEQELALADCVNLLHQQVLVLIDSKNQEGETSG